MEKKKVRIYKAGGNTGQYINKTAQWMMQMSGTPNISQIGYPSQQQTQQVTEDELINLVVSDLSNQIPENQIAFKLVTIHKLEPVMAKQFIESIKNKLVTQNEEEEEDIQKERVDKSEMFTNEEEEEPSFETEDEQALYQNTSEQDDDTEFAADLIMKYGGSKRNYVKSVLKLVKKEMGGDTESNDTDPIGEDLRKKRTNSFINTVKDQAFLANAKELAEQEYEQMLQQQALQNFIPNYQEQDYMQFGGQRRAMRQFNRAMKNLPITMQPVTKFDVRRSGLFGRPKEYSIEFGMNPLMQLANPMLANMYGYGRVPTGTKSQGRIVTETVSKANNKKATEEVASQTNSEAAATSAKPTLEEMRAAAEAAGDWNYTPLEQTNTVNNNTTSNTTSNTIHNNSENRQTSVNTENDVVVKPSIKKDKWGRPEGSEWYGFDPNKENWNLNQFKGGNKIEGEKYINSQFNSYNPAMYKAPDGTYKYRPMAAYADDDLISSIVLGAPDWSINFGKKIINSVGNKLFNTGTKNTLGKGRNMLNPGQKMLNKGQKMLNPGQKMLNPPPGYQYKLPFQSGGSINNPFQDPYGNLQKFISGGYDISQEDIDDVYSKDSTDPYIAAEGWEVTNPNNIVDNYNPRFGSSINDRYPTQQTQQNPFGNTPNMLGNFGNQVMGNYGFYNPFINNRILPGMPQYMGSWNKMIGTPYDKRTGQQFMGIPGFNPNAQISNIDVTKTGILGRPKKYTITYNNNPTGKPEDRQLAYSTPQINNKSKNNNVYSNTNNLDFSSKMAIRQGERKTAKELARGEKQNLNASDANLDPYPGFPLDHPIRQTKNLPFNSAPNYIKPQDKSLITLSKNQYGGLHKFLPKAYTGKETPVTQDERFETLPLLTSNQTIQDLSNQSKQNIINQTNFQPDQYSVDYKRKDMFAGNAAEALPWVNAGLLGVAGTINRFRDNNRQAEMYKNLTSDNLYASDPSRDRGDYETNSGLYRPDEMGQTWNSRSKQYGGENDFYNSVLDYAEGDEVDMSPEELEAFLAAGGEIY